MENELADYKLPYMGAYFNLNDVLDFLVKSNNISKEAIVTENGLYYMAETSDGMQIWYEIDDDNCIEDFSVHYKTDTRNAILLDGWTTLSDNKLSGIAYVWNKNDVEFPMNLDVVNAGWFSDFEKGEFVVQITAFGNNVKIYSDEETYKKSEEKLAPESCIPIGTFPVNYDDSTFTPSSHILMSGVITFFEKRKNTYTNGEYYYLLVKCLGLNFDVLLRMEDVQEVPVIGGIISGVLYLSAFFYDCKLYENNVNTIKDLEKIQVKKRTQETGHIYSIDINPDVPVSLDELERYVKPIIEDMKDISDDFLTIGYHHPRQSDSIAFIQAAKDGEKYHLEVGIKNKSSKYPTDIYTLEQADFNVVYDTFKLVIVDRKCPDLSNWYEYSSAVFD